MIQLGVDYFVAIFCRENHASVEKNDRRKEIAVRIRSKVAALASVAVAASWLIASAAPASAAGECGAGYVKAGDYQIGSLGSLEVYYNSAKGKNCAITRATKPRSGFKQVAIGLAGKVWSDVDEGTYTYYAGPVYVSARGQCIDVRGYIGKAVVMKRGVHCG
ncbi:spore-associated protein A [Nonomuraea sp. NPDC000554]|uniref:spore-associated protein A n=1 Tax=Nonomuraea sp. NPDC000554 TaxID=3154259 RepID=UPI003330A659